MAEILVPLDGSPQAQRAVPLAVGLARASGHGLRLIEAVSLGISADVPESAPMLEEAAQETMRAAQEEIVARYNLPVETTVEMGFAPDAI
ncbi:MAG: universal stress protein, partial [Bacteroidota bacterium]|nr:universal stress protein [Bacteroidota bacterium]